MNAEKHSAKTQLVATRGARYRWLIANTFVQSADVEFIAADGARNMTGIGVTISVYAKCLLLLSNERHV